MIPWIKYDKYSREIESHVPHLVTDGKRIELACHAKLIGKDGYGWHIDAGRIFGVTHYAHINLPIGEDTDNA
ncbi:hypothetical protein D3C75_563840 [compost metagenome]